MNTVKLEIKKRLSDKIIDWHEHSGRRIYIKIKAQDLKEISNLLFFDHGLRFCTASGQDTPLGIEILYHFGFDYTGEIFSLRVLLEDKKNLKIDSLTPLFPAAEWIEREMWELLGIDFIGHPNLKKLLLDDEWPQGKYPLRHEHES
ncbi:MAG: hypothetical protein DRP74_04385 [Candidatus Omnitrophota bacterium]|nr:MAG: hypothetical protein DRP74_04385 [Candidatus Omnitrophota bacterium]